MTVGETEIQAEARLRLRGTAKEWRFLAPYNAEVTVGRAPALGSAPKPIEFPPDQAPDVVRPEPGKSDWRIRFREANSTELLVVIGTHTPRNRGQPHRLAGRSIRRSGCAKTRRDDPRPLAAAAENDGGVTIARRHAAR